MWRGRIRKLPDPWRGTSPAQWATGRQGRQRVRLLFPAAQCVSVEVINCRKLVLVVLLNLHPNDVRCGGAARIFHVWAPSIQFKSYLLIYGLYLKCAFESKQIDQKFHGYRFVFYFDNREKRTNNRNCQPEVCFRLRSNCICIGVFEHNFISFNLFIFQIASLHLLPFCYTFQTHLDLD